MVEAIQMEKIPGNKKIISRLIVSTKQFHYVLLLGIKFRLDLRVKEVNRPPVTHFQASGLEEAREADFICLLA